MIAASSPRDTSLDLVKLIFSLTVDSSQNVPEELKQHLTEVLTEAKFLLSESDHDPTKVTPEAIELALEMKASNELASSVEEITTFDSISPIIANKVLEAMRRIHPAY